MLKRKRIERKNQNRERGRESPVGKAKERELSINKKVAFHSLDIRLPENGTKAYEKEITETAFKIRGGALNESGVRYSLDDIKRKSNIHFYSHFLPSMFSFISENVIKDLGLRISPSSKEKLSSVMSSLSAEMKKKAEKSIDPEATFDSHKKNLNEIFGANTENFIKRFNNYSVHLKKANSILHNRSLLLAVQFLR